MIGDHTIICKRCGKPWTVPDGSVLGVSLCPECEAKAQQTPAWFRRVCRLIRRFRDGGSKMGPI
jgi:hypothetical protein